MEKKDARVNDKNKQEQRATADSVPLKEAGGTSTEADLLEKNVGHAEEETWETEHDQRPEDDDATGHDQRPEDDDQDEEEDNQFRYSNAPEDEDEDGDDGHDEEEGYDDNGEEDADCMYVAQLPRLVQIEVRGLSNKEFLQGLHDLTLVWSNEPEEPKFRSAALLFAFPRAPRPHRAFGLCRGEKIARQLQIMLDGHGPNSKGVKPIVQVTLGPRLLPGEQSTELQWGLLEALGKMNAERPLKEQDCLVINAGWSMEGLIRRLAKSLPI